MQIREKLKKAYRLLCYAEVTISAVCLIFTVVVIFALAVLRSFDMPIRWALDSALLVFAWGVFLGADVALREDKLIRADFLVLALPEKVQRVLYLVVNLLIAAFLISLIYYGIGLSISTQHRSFQGIPELSFTWVTVSIPVSCTLMLITTTIKTYNLAVQTNTAKDEGTNGEGNRPAQ